MWGSAVGGEDRTQKVRPLFGWTAKNPNASAEDLRMEVWLDTGKRYLTAAEEEHEKVRIKLTAANRGLRRARARGDP